MPQQKIGFYGKFTPTGVDTSGAQRLQALAQLSSQVGDIAYKIGVKKATEAGETAGLEAGTKAAQEGTPIAPKDSIFPTAFDDAYNRAMKTSYIAGVQGNARQNLSRISIEAGNDVDLFNQMAQEWRKGASGGVSQEMMPYFNSTVTELTQAYSASVSDRAAAFNFKASGEALADSVTTFMDDALSFTKLGNDKLASDALGEAYAAIDAQVGTYITETQAQIAKREIQRQVHTEFARKGMMDILQQKNVYAAVGFINSLENATVEGFNPDEQRKMVDLLRSDLSQHLSLQSAQDTAAARELAKAQEANTSAAIIGILNGNLGMQDVIRMGNNSQVDSTQLSQLTTLLNNRGKGVDNYSLLYQINSILATDPEGARELVYGAAGVSLTENTALDLLTKIDNVVDKESPLGTSKAKRFRTYLRDLNVKVGPGGALDFDEQQRFANLALVFDERVMAGEDPAVVANDLVDVSNIIKKKYTTVESIDKAIADLQSKAGTMTREEYAKKKRELDGYKERLELYNLYERDLQKALKGI